jgi:hypothetical protein
VELTHWLTDVSDSVANQMRDDAEKLKDVNDINEPNMPGDANGFGSAELNGSESNPNIDPESQKIFDELLKNQ